MEEDKRVKEVIKACAMEENEFCSSEWKVESMKSELRRLKKYMRTHWYTILCTLKQILPEKKKSKKAFKRDCL